ncbi:Hexadecenal dehydrogenase [Yamadazyma tenuis]|uniref:Aldehyde dehydrogenase n=1 Tax=Candida tenuis (strain ATCC 10573 / BCRC 21748 / CBS 615 / JCM 9827 / NBRC 10315 / NRRL Y-1498 / VKM Y-70) TaxID=590646 RepID=G3AZ77_CANTC|nr:aldehyde dehydrogenase [Yamadazyma tenuis ATCC 10573]EGV66028.1 aldehyde dehydrogenase [Yamadazyma tenuis ATCC 10573]WEJ95632.1 Hexadecenal dehydrogenase [Yamadazyma tenuis]
MSPSAEKTELHSTGSTRSTRSGKSSAPSTTTSNSPLKYTPVEEIPVKVKQLVNNFHEHHKLHPLQSRVNQLRNVYFAIKDNEDLICEALAKDFHRSPFETQSLEMCVLLNEILHTISSLHKWSRPEKVHDLTINVATQPVYIERIPFGVVLVMSPFNYPLLLTVSSLVGAIAGGNSVVLKLPESTPHFSSLLTSLLKDALDEDIFYVVNGAIAETTAVLDQKFDKIMYTGSTVVGKIVAKKAAETLTPVLLELGGKSPGFVLNDVKDSQLATVAKRILWGKFSNGGQTCVAIDYLLVDDAIKDKLIKALLEQAELMFPGIDSESDWTHLIHDRAFGTLIDTIKKTDGTIIYGGQSDEKTRFIAPTIIDNVKFNDSTMRQENFGPVLPIISYSDLTSVLKSVIQSHDCPLAQYIFTGGKTSRANPQIDQILTYLRSGGTLINDTLVHVALPNAPFGGIGNSGTGSYHGYFSFRAFTHERTTIEQALWNDFLLKSRYPPFSDKKAAFIKNSMAPQREWFDRTGNVKSTGPSIFYKVYDAIATATSIGYTAIANRV